MTFAGHFHVHDEFSPLDGAGNRNQLTKEAVKNGDTHLGCTNHGRLGSALDHVHACRHPELLDDPDNPGKKRGKDETLIPILGLESFWRPDRFMDLTDKDKYGKNGHNWAQHLCLHAGSLTGWRTLMRLSSKSWVKREQGGGFYGKPCIDWDMLEQDHEGIIISTACLSSPLSHLILEGHEDEAKGWLEDMIDIVGERNVFIEIMPHDLDAQRQVNIAKINLANELGLPYMVTGDVHMPYKEWEDTQSIVRMAAYGTSISKQDKKKDAGEEIYTEQIDTIYLSSEQELAEMFAQHHPDLPEGVVKEGLDNTSVFAGRVKPYVIGKTQKLPKVTKSPEHAEKILRAWIDEGMKRIGKTLVASYRERWRYEFGVLKGKGVLDYFVMVGDMVRWAKSDKGFPKEAYVGRTLLKGEYVAKGERVVRNKKTGEIVYEGTKRPIRVGLGRGSAAGSLISYLIGITAIDPIAWGLLFERFLNPDRVGLPDIDLDFETEEPVLPIIEIEMKDGEEVEHEVWLDGRDCVKEYCRRLYGRDHVADIIAYQTFAPRAVIKAVALTQDISFPVIQSVTDTIGDTDRGLEKIAKDNEAVAKFKEKFPDVWKHCLRLEDQILRDSRHAGGVVITDKPTNFYMPTQIGSDEKSIVTAWADRADFPIVSDYGFVKMDILGVKGLAKQELAVQLIRKHFDIDVEPNDLPVLKDPYATEQEVIDIFVKGLTVGVFQFGGRGITGLLRHIKPDSAIDIAVANALYRPGPIDQAFKYGDRKNGTVPESQWYWHEAVEPLLRETYGILAFQEQVMEITKILGKFTGGQADSMRKAISKLYRLPGDEARQFMQGFKDQWHTGCDSNGLREEDAEVIWAAILEFAGYGFNKSHSASYALQAYQDAHLKWHYPSAFFSSLLTVERKSKKDEQIDFLKRVMREADMFDVTVHPPDVNLSERGWIVEAIDAIRYGLVSISGLGSAAALEVMEHRPYTSFNQYLQTVPSTLGTNVHESLAKAGAFDRLAAREQLLARTRQWPETTARYKVTMGCGCKKNKTVKLSDNMIDQLYLEFEKTDVEGATNEERMLMATEIVMEELECTKHPGHFPQDWEEVDPYYSTIAWMKDNPRAKEPPVMEEPSLSEIMEMEVAALNLPLSLRRLVAQYKEFIAERVFTEQETDELPSKPKKKGDMHGGHCQCDTCLASKCVIGGEITNVRVMETKRNKEKMAKIEVAFGADQWSVTLFPYHYRKFAHLLSRPTAVLIKGNKDMYDGKPQIIAYDIQDVVDVARAAKWDPPPLADDNDVDTPDLVVVSARKPRKKKSKFKIQPKVAA